MASDKQKLRELHAALEAALTLDTAAAEALWREFVAAGGASSKGPRSVMLARMFEQTAAMAKLLGWDGTAVLQDGRVLVDQDGVLLTTREHLRHFRKNGIAPARGMIDFMRNHRIEPKVIFDIGANIGEIALYLAHHSPNARVFAFEPAPENIADFEANIAVQRAPPANLHFVKEAVSDRTGVIEMTVGGGDLNTVLVEGNIARLNQGGGVQVATMPTDTLENFCRRFEVDRIDFMKLDIEGAEPLLAPSLRAMPGRLGAAYVEISRYNEVEAYLDLIDAFAAAGLAMLSKGRLEKDPEGVIRAALEKGPALNVWFVERSRL